MRRGSWALLAVLLAAGCGGDDEPAEAPAVLAIEATEPGPGRYRLVVPESVEAGVVELRLRNSGRERHEVQLLRLDDDHTVEEALRVVSAEDGKIPDWFHAAGGVGATAPGALARATVELEEGRYHLVDTGSGEGERSFAQGGAVAALTVTEGDGSGELPEAAGEIEMQDYGFEATGLRPGVNTLTLRNTGNELHHTVVVPIAGDASIEAVREFLTSDEPPSGRPPVDFRTATATAVLDGGLAQVAQLDLKAGRYAFVCFITDRAGGPPHVEKGMLAEVLVPTES